VKVRFEPGGTCAVNNPIPILTAIGRKPYPKAQGAREVTHRRFGFRSPAGIVEDRSRMV